VFTQGCGITAHHGSGQPIEGSEGIGAAGSIGIYAHALLKLAQGSISIWTKDAIGPPGIETKFVEAPLKLANIITGHQVPGSETQDPIPELPSGFIKMAEGCRANDAVHPDTAFLLKGSHRRIEFIIENNVAHINICEQLTH
jgi:hypothetical protein